MLKKLIILILLPLLFLSCTIKKNEEITISSCGSVTETKILKHIIKDFVK